MMPDVCVESFYSDQAVSIHPTLLQTVSSVPINWVPATERRQLAGALLPRSVVVGSPSSMMAPPLDDDSFLDGLAASPYRLSSGWRVYRHHSIRGVLAPLDQHAMRLFPGFNRVVLHLQRSKFGWATRDCNASEVDRAAEIAYMAGCGIKLDWGVVNGVVVNKETGLVSICINADCRAHNNAVAAEAQKTIQAFQESGRAILTQSKQCSFVELERLQLSMQYGISAAGMAVYVEQKRIDATMRTIMTPEVYDDMIKKTMLDVSDLDIGITEIPFHFVPLAFLASEILIDKRAYVHCILVCSRRS
jgi:hypothetical protein